MSKSVTIVDYGLGNIHSVRKQVLKYGFKCIVSSSPSEILEARKLILPGVGHFGKAMDNLYNIGLIDVLNESVLVKKTPILGICLGMQLMAKYSEEGSRSGLGWFGGTVVKFNVEDSLRFKVPHMGWNQIIQKKKSIILEGTTENAEFYFVHSFHFSAENSADVLTETTYSYTFPSAIERGNVIGVQFHPEKSHDAGTRLLRNFIES
jgi:imidazole glycerol-phosphate synthase subunit HisH